MNNNVTIILPTKNEAKAIGKVMEDIRALPIEAKVLVIDGLSKDYTVKIAKKLGATVMYEKRSGKGVAVRRALKKVKTPYVVMIDADNTYPVEDIPIMIDLLKEYDIVKGHRSWLENGAMTKTHHFGNWALSLLATVLYWKRTRDVCSGMWVMKMDKVRQFSLVSNGFTLEADLFINTVKTGCSLKEIPIVYRKRIEEDKAKLMLKDGFEIGWFLIKSRLSHQRAQDRF